jgi:hypothetical protein
MEKVQLKNEAEELIEKIYEFKKEKCNDLSLLDTIIEYAYIKNISLQEIGNILSEHKIFIKIFKKQLQEERYFRMTEDEQNTLDMQINEDEW